jgi:hypothetical protein
MTTFCQAGTFTILGKNVLCCLYVNPKIAQLLTIPCFIENDVNKCLPN